MFFIFENFFINLKTIFTLHRMFLLNLISESILLLANKTDYFLMRKKSRGTVLNDFFSTYGLFVTYISFFTLCRLVQSNFKNSWRQQVITWLFVKIRTSNFSILSISRLLFKKIACNTNVYSGTISLHIGPGYYLKEKQVFILFLHIFSSRYYFINYF